MTAVSGRTRERAARFVTVVKGQAMKQERVRMIEKLVAGLVGYEMKNEPDDACGEVLVRVAYFRGGVTSAKATKERAYSKDAIAALMRDADVYLAEAHA